MRSFLSLVLAAAIAIGAAPAAAVSPTADADAPATAGEAADFAACLMNRTASASVMLPADCATQVASEQAARVASPARRSGPEAPLSCAAVPDINDRPC